MKKIEKVVSSKGYLLGVMDGDWIYLKPPSWDCGWYWGFGYLKYHRMNNKSYHIHTHFDSVFFECSRYESTDWNSKSSYDRLCSLERCTLTKDEIWKLLDYMKTFYTLRESAEVLGRGGSHYTSKANLDVIKNEEMVHTINHIMLPALFKEIEKLFTEE